MPTWIVTALAGLVMLVSWCGAAAAAQPTYGAPARPWNASLGNHRARVRVARKAGAVRAHLLWRRRDADPQTKAVWVVNLADGTRVKNVAVCACTRLAGEVVFQADRAGEYGIYFMPFRIHGRAFPRTEYFKAKGTADKAWLARYKLTRELLPAGAWRALPEAKVLAFESRTEFDRRDPMERIASDQEKRELLARNTDKAYLVFPEDRRYPIRMTDDLPHRWIVAGAAGTFRGRAQPNEFYVLQLGVWAARKALANVRVTFSDLAGPGRAKLPATALRCFNTGGVDWLGRKMTKRVDVPAGKVQALWIGVDLPRDLPAGRYEGVVTVHAGRAGSTPVRLVLDIAGKPLADRGDGELWRLARLRWLDSGAGLDETVTAPYTPLEVSSQTVRCLGRSVTLDSLGLPKAIHVGTSNILAEGVRFVVADAAGRPVKWQADPVRFLRKGEASVTWRGRAKAGKLTLQCTAKMEFDGYVNYQLALTASEAVSLADCRLEIPLRREFAEYMMGMGCKGGTRPPHWQWTWDPAKHQDSIWIGSVPGGLQCKLKGPNYRWPLVNIHYHRRPLLMPEAWHNAGQGGCKVAQAGDRVVLRAYGGPRKMTAGQELRFDFGLLITPVKPPDPKAHWRTRYYHSGVPDLDKVAQAGATVVNIHHANRLNPFINYPFLRTKELADYVRQAHAKGLKLKIYYTIRELSNHCAELWALRSLGDEIYADGPGGGYAWLHEHLVTGYSPAWHHPFGDGVWCASISQTGLSRWHNYYVEGLGWLVRNVGIDGLYLDEIGYDREIMKRVRRVLDADGRGRLLDLHSWNHFNGRAGYANCLNLYLEHMPYLDSLWIGEGRNYNEGPDHWLVEVSGIPFGLFSEMLQGGGHPWRGMLYGMTGRLPWAGDPKPIWKLWDDFGIAESDMIGYWVPKCPVTTGRKDVLATVYRREGASLIALAGWNKKPAKVKLKIDFASLGLDPKTTVLEAPAIAKLQTAATFRPADPLPIAAGGGLMLIARETKARTPGTAPKDPSQ